METLWTIYLFCWFGLILVTIERHEVFYYLFHKKKIQIILFVAVTVVVFAPIYFVVYLIPQLNQLIKFTFKLD